MDVFFKVINFYSIVMSVFAKWEKKYIDKLRKKNESDENKNTIIGRTV